MNTQFPGSENTPKETVSRTQQAADIYPTPKTYDEHLAERAEVRAIRDSWQTKHPWAKIIIIVLLLGSSLLLLLSFGPPLMFSAPITGVPLFLLLGLVWVFCLIAAIRTIRNMIDTNPHL